MDTKKWYQSKLVWLGVLTTLLGIFPLVNVYIHAVAPGAELVVEATGAFLAGIITVVLRIWFTDTGIQ